MSFSVINLANGGISKWTDKFYRPVLKSLVIVFLSCGIPQRIYAHDMIDPANIVPERGASANGRAVTTKSPAGLSAQALTLNDIQDAGIILNLIRQQSINIYQEASRTESGLDSPDTIVEPTTIPIPQSSGKSLPPRDEWLVFYVGIIEPVIRQLSTHVDDIHSGTKQLVISPGLIHSIEPLWQSWALDIKDLNHNLDELVPLFDSPNENSSKIRSLSVAIFQNTNKLDAIRKQIFAILKTTIESGSSKVLISPP